VSKAETTHKVHRIRVANPGHEQFRIFPFLFLMLLAFPVHTVFISRPFLPNIEGTATAIPVMHAVNFARYGPLASRFAAILNTGQVEPRNWVLYAHHPPLVPLLISAGYSLFGVSEWSTRLFPVFFTLASTALLYLLALRQFGETVAFLAGFFYCCAPITVAFGGMPDYINGQVGFFILASVGTYLRWYETRQPQWLWLLLLSGILGALSGWPIFFSAVVLYGHYWVNCPEQSFKKKLFPGLLVSALFFGLIVWADIAGEGTSIFNQIYYRTIGGTDLSGLANSINTIMTYNLGRLHTLPICLLALAFVAIIVFKLLNRKWSDLHDYDTPMLLLLIAGLHLSLAFKGNQQPWWSVIVTAPLSLAAALCVESLRALTQNRGMKNFITAAIATLFISFSIPEAYRQVTTQWEHARSAGYTVKELGSVIKSVSQPYEGVVTSDMIWDATLWFYSDRQLRPAVTTISGLNQSLGPGPYPLRDWYFQPDGPSPRWFVLPSPHRTKFRELANELDARFPRRDFNGYSIFRLS
jgi:4-amino-4-deoxy-L-arabinose transferase-like glycosyltransferase